MLGALHACHEAPWQPHRPDKSVVFAIELLDIWFVKIAKIGSQTALSLQALI